MNPTRLDDLLASSSPLEITDDARVRDAVARAVREYRPRRVARRPVVVSAIIGGCIVAGTTAAALPSIFSDFGRIDYQSTQEYTVDGRGPFRCEFAFRVDPPVDGKVLEPAAGAPDFETVLEFVRTHDWAFDDQPVALTTPTYAQGATTGLSVISTFIRESWHKEVAEAYPLWLSSVGGISEAGQCDRAADGSAP
jgi:hypothetical protein